MVELLVMGVQEAHNMGLVGLDFAVAVALGGWGWQLYSTVEKPSDEWDKFLKSLSVVMMALGVIDLLVIVFRLM